MRKIISFAVLLVAFAAPLPAFQEQAERPRARDLGITPGVFAPGPLNAITDVEGVRVGHYTLREGDSVRTGVTAILPHNGNLYQVKVTGSMVVGNGFGKLIGMTQVNELGQIETPILLTNTLAVWDAATALVDYMLALPGNEGVRSINPVVGETNDGGLNNIRSRPLERRHFLAALQAAATGPVEEGSVGAGTGTRAFGFKGGIGTSSRHLPADLGGYTIGVLVQTNFGGVLTIDGVPVGEELGRYAYKEATAPNGDGSCMIVVATDAPLNARQLKRLARRALAGMARTGASFSNGSGDYVIAFSTQREGVKPREQELSPLFQAAIEATEEAIYNSLLKATTVTGRDGNTAEAISIEEVKRILKKYGRGK
jgi:D-aminopeptidase